MSEKKHLAEWVMDFIDVSRLARAAAEKLENDDAYDFVYAIDAEAEALADYMRRSWERIHRLKVIASRVAEGGSKI